MKVVGFILILGIAGQSETNANNATATTTNSTDPPATTTIETPSTVVTPTTATKMNTSTDEPTTGTTGVKTGTTAITTSTAVVTSSSTEATVPCKPGYWGEHCFFLCSDGCNGENKECRRYDGRCVEGCKKTTNRTDNVHTHEEGENGLCSEARCDEIGGCGPEGLCIAHNKCVCPKLYTAVKGEHKGMETMTCKSLRLDGIKGGIAALLVMMLSISFCAAIQSYCSKTKPRSYSYVD